MKQSILGVLLLLSTWAAGFVLGSMHVAKEKETVYVPYPACNQKRGDILHGS